MFEISEETLKELKKIKETCYNISCNECKYYINANNECENKCKLNYPFNWNLKSGD